MTEQQIIMQIQKIFKHIQTLDKMALEYGTSSESIDMKIRLEQKLSNYMVIYDGLQQ